MNPAFPMVRVEPDQIQAVFCSATILAAHLDFRDQQRRAHRRAAPLGWAHAPDEAAAELVDPIQGQCIGFPGPETRIDERQSDRHVFDW